MSSDIYVLGGNSSSSSSSFYSNSIPEMVFSDSSDFLFSSPVDETFFQEILSNTHQNPDEETLNFPPNFISSSPPSTQFEKSLNLYPNQAPKMQSFSNGYGDLGELSSLEVKNEELQVGFDSGYGNFSAPQNYTGAENAGKYLQRSFSENCFDSKPGFEIPFQPQFNSLMESQNFQTSPENSFFAGQIRRVCSTGDLQNARKDKTTQRSFSSPLATENSFMEESGFKVVRYSAEERKHRISKYRAKRNQRNFNKTIKYACRKTLADSRPRIRGRFARNDEAGEIPKSLYSTRDEEDDEIWFDGGHEEDESMGKGVTFGGNLGPQQFQYYGCF